MNDRTLRAALIAFALVGAAVAGYVLVSHWTDSGLICSTGGCETVQSSEYAKLLGVPVAAFGVAGYLLIAAAAALGTAVARVSAAALALGAAAFSGYLLVVQLAVIDAVCDWCVLNDVISSLVAVAALGWLVRADMSAARA